MIKSSKATFEAEAVLIYAKADCLFAVRFLLFGDVDGGREWKGEGEGITIHPGRRDGAPGCMFLGVRVGVLEYVQRIGLETKRTQAKVPPQVRAVLLSVV